MDMNIDTSIDELRSLAFNLLQNKCAGISIYDKDTMIALGAYTKGIVDFEIEIYDKHAYAVKSGKEE